MEHTRVEILDNLEAWANAASTPNVYWLNGQLGTGKTSIAHTLCERLDAQKKLGGSFFCSRSGLTDARRIIPTIASMLAQSNQTIQLAIHEVLKKKPNVADLNDLSEQFRSLIVNPVKLAAENEHDIHYIIVIDAMDECSGSGIVEMLINAILDGVTDIPLKFFITSRPETWIRRAFNHIAASSLLQEFALHKVAINDNEINDIETYLKTSLSQIADNH